MVLRTSNGGQTWNRLKLPALHGQEPVEAFPPRFFTPRDGIMRVVVHVGFSQSEVAFYKTTNGGCTWAEGETLVWDNGGGIFKSSLASFATAKAGLALVRITSPSTGQVTKATLLRTNDSGARWSVLKTNLPLRKVSAIDMVTQALGFAATPGHVWKTSDGGRVWQRIG